jgi:ABC-type Zn2+ transport system substrate-binding protein/surface adhesin
MLETIMQSEVDARLVAVSVSLLVPPHASTHTYNVRTSRII